MINGREIGVREIAQDAVGARMRAELRSDWAISILCRPPSVVVTWAALKLRLCPMQVTVFALILALTIPLQAAFLPLHVAVWAVALSGFVFQVLDCVDGTLARLTNTASKFGGDVDFLVDMAQWGLLYTSIGILADRWLESGFLWTALAASAAWGRLFARVIRDRLKETDEQNTDANPKPLHPSQYVPAFIAGLSGLIPFFALTGPFLGIAVIVLAIYALLDITEGLLPLIKRR